MVACRVTASVRESLGRLQLTYIDLIQTHDIEFGSLDQVGTGGLGAPDLGARWALGA